MELEGRYAQYLKNRVEVLEYSLADAKESLDGVEALQAKERGKRHRLGLIDNVGELIGDASERCVVDSKGFLEKNYVRE